MRRIVVPFLIAIFSAMSFAQTSPEALYERGMDAISGANTSRNDHDAIGYFRRSAEAGYAPAQVALGYLLDTGTLMAGSQTQAIDWYKKAASQGDLLAPLLSGRGSAPGYPRGAEVAGACRRAGQSVRRILPRPDHGRH